MESVFMQKTTIPSVEKNIRVVHFNDPEWNSVFMTFVIRIGFAYKYAYFLGEPNSRELNHGFSHVFSSYLNLFGMNGQGQKCRVTPFRGSVCVSLESDKNAYLNDTKSLYDELFSLKPNEQDFIVAKEDAMRRLEKVYAQPFGKAMLHSLEFSDKNKGFMLMDFFNGIQALDYHTFLECIQAFIHPSNTILSIVGDQEVREGVSVMQLNDRANTYQPFALCGEKQDPYLQNDAHTILVGQANFLLCCQKFYILNTDVPLVQRYLLLDMLCAARFRRDCDVSVDIYDASIIYWGSADAVRPQEIRGLFTDEAWVEEGKQAILQQIEYQRKKEPENFYVWWSNLFLEGINLGSYIELVLESSAQSLTELFDVADILVTEGAVMLTKVKQ